MLDGDCQPFLLPANLFSLVWNSYSPIKFHLIFLPLCSEGCRPYISITLVTLRAIHLEECSPGQFSWMHELEGITQRADGDHTAGWWRWTLLISAWPMKTISLSSHGKCTAPWFTWGWGLTWEGESDAYLALGQGGCWRKSIQSRTNVFKMLHYVSHKIIQDI